MNFTKEDIVNALGISLLDPQLQEQTVGAFLITLEQRTGQAVSDQLSDEQLQELEKVVQASGDEAGEEWLRKTVEGYDAIEEVEYNKLVAEIVASGTAMTSK